MKYIKELDNIRALAIFSVLTTHWTPSTSIVHFISMTIAAPNIFFALSGFLITKILLNDRNKAEAYNTSKIVVFKNFFFKRALRTFPAYYLIIFIDYFLSKKPITEYYSYLNYTANFHIYSVKSWGPLPHLWSMSVEQQFYLIWPWLILFIPKKFLLPTIVLFILVGIFTQHLFPYDAFLFLLPFTCFDTLGLGALLAWFAVFKSEATLVKMYKVLRPLAFISFILIICQAIWGNFFLLYNRTLMAIIVIWAIAYFMLRETDSKSKLAFLYNSKGLRLIGKFSYGIYLYHITLSYYSFEEFHRLNQQLPFPAWVTGSGFLLVLEELTFIFGLAWLSWKFFELPLSHLKRYFNNKPGNNKRLDQELVLR